MRRRVQDKCPACWAPRSDRKARHRAMSGLLRQLWPARRGHGRLRTSVVHPPDLFPTIVIKTQRLLAAIFAALSPLASAGPNWLVSPEEVRQEAAWEASHVLPVRSKTRALTVGGPDIDLLAPASLAAPLKAPFPIRLAFKARDGATIKPESFRALYGFLKIDITERLVSRAKIGPGGIEVDKADIPAGNHRLTLRISDDRERQTETEVRFSVE